MYVMPEVSLRWQVNSRLSMNFSYRNRFGGEFQQYTGSFGAAWRF
jgi:hypothetical protein